MKILIADSGSTKTDWALVDEQGNVMVTCKTQGISPIHQSDAEILDVLCKELVLSEQPQQVFFYGSGVTEAMKSRMKSLLQQSFLKPRLRQKVICWEQPVPSLARNRVSPVFWEPVPTVVFTMERRL